MILLVHLNDIYQMKEDDMGGACSTRGRVEKCVKYYGWKT